MKLIVSKVLKQHFVTITIPRSRDTDHSMKCPFNLRPDKTFITCPSMALISGLDDGVRLERMKGNDGLTSFS